MSTTPDSVQGPAADRQYAVRNIGTADLNWALAEGWRDFKSKRGDLILAGLLYPLIGVFAAAFTLNSELLPLLFPLVAGLSLLGPAVASGFYELARRREAGQDTSWSHFFDPLKGRSRAPLAVLTLGLAALFVGWLIAAWFIYRATLAGAAPMGADGFLAALFGTPEGWAMIGVGMLVGFGFAVAALVLSVVSFPMVIDKPVDAETAASTSIRAVRANPGPIAGWGLRIAGLLALGAIPLFIGLAVVLPVVGYATWHLYTRLVDR